MAGFVSVHVFVLKSYAHVSLEPPYPPNRMTRSDRESYAIAEDSRGPGATAGFMAVHVFVLKSYAQVSPRVIPRQQLDRKSTRLNSSHRTISYAVFCLKKK